jgi:hypothetical protein
MPFIATSLWNCLADYITRILDKSSDDCHDSSFLPDPCLAADYDHAPALDTPVNQRKIRRNMYGMSRLRRLLHQPYFEMIAFGFYPLESRF